VEELWYVLHGEGEVWRRLDAAETVLPVAPGWSLLIPCGTAFQFRSTGSAPLELVIATMPPWPGAAEAETVLGHWPGPDERGTT
jgi:mannose-6-phosphate isomerase-like protein (cupin superfamily)